VLTIDELLDDALLAKEPPVPRDIVPYEDHAYPGDQWSNWPAAHSRRDDSAAQNLLTLCTTVVNSPAIAPLLADFVTDQLPAPAGARVLACVLQLAGMESGARFWWQYAAGAGDDTSSYCLYLFHLSHGETYAAGFWHGQTTIDTPPGTAPTAAHPQSAQAPQEPSGDACWGPVDISTPTLLRIITRLLADPDLPCLQIGLPRSRLATAVMDYVPSVVAAGYTGHPDVEIPLPGPLFAERLAVIADTTRAKTIRRNPSGDTRPDLCRRPVHREAPRDDAAAPHPRSG
jgi:hypothetical protein